MAPPFFVLRRASVSLFQEAPPAQSGSHVRWYGSSNIGGRNAMQGWGRFQEGGGALKAYDVAFKCYQGFATWGSNDSIPISAQQYGWQWAFLLGNTHGLDSSVPVSPGRARANSYLGKVLVNNPTNTGRRCFILGSLPLPLPLPGANATEDGSPAFGSAPRPPALSWKDKTALYYRILFLFRTRSVSFETFG